MNSENTIELTGNGFIDAYNLGFEAGKTLVEQEKQCIDSRRWDEYRRANAAEKERDELKEEVLKLKKRIKKLKKGGRE